MSIIVNEEKKLFTLQTRHSTYQMRVDSYGFLRNLYYGARIDDADMSYMHIGYERSFSPVPNCAGFRREYTLDVVPQEYTGCGLSDFRISSFGIINADGSSATEFYYASYEILEGKYKIPGQPAVYARCRRVRERKMHDADVLFSFVFIYLQNYHLYAKDKNYS